MITNIGIAAGEIWQYLDQNGEINLNELLNRIEKDRDVVIMSLGWLAREGHIVLEQIESDYRIRLREKQESIKP